MHWDWIDWRKQTPTSTQASATSATLTSATLTSALTSLKHRFLFFEYKKTVLQINQKIHSFFLLPQHEKMLKKYFHVFKLFKIQKTSIFKRFF